MFLSLVIYSLEDVDLDDNPVSGEVEEKINIGCEFEYSVIIEVYEHT